MLKDIFITIRITIELKKKLQKMAKQQDRSMSWIACDLIKKGMEAK